MLALEPSKVKSLHEVFPNLADGLLDCTKFKLHGYSSFAISVFDHWLSNDEAANLMPNFEGPLHESRNEPRFKVLRSLADEAFVVELDASDSLVFWEFQSALEKDDLITKAVYSEDLITLCLPTKSTIVCIGHDYTDYVYYDSKTGDIESIRSSSKARGLHCI